MTQAQHIRVGADVALDVRGTMYSTKVLANDTVPEQAILDGIAIVTEQAGISLSEIDLSSMARLSPPMPSLSAAVRARLWWRPTVSVT